jgi:hypothetical protein
MSRFSRQRVIDLISEEMNEIAAASSVTPKTDPSTLQKASEFISLGKLLALDSLRENLLLKAGIGLRVPVAMAEEAAETRKTVDTRTAARILGREPGTLRRWNSQGWKAAPVKPVGRSGRDLAWSVEDLLAHKQAVERGEVFTPRDSAKEGEAQ